MGGKRRKAYENAEGVLVKECSQCGAHKPVTEFNKDTPHDRLRAECRDCNAAKARSWRERNPDRVSRRSREQKRLESLNPRKVLDKRIGGGLSYYLQNRTIENCGVFVNLEFSGPQLLRHLESSFHGKMSWENYGRFGWHLEHKKPLAAFSYQAATDPEFTKAWSLDNLQPLWWHENLWKGARYTGDNDNEALNFRGALIAA